MSAQPLVTLLAAAAKDRVDRQLLGLDAAHVQWAVTNGLGPWLHRCAALDATEAPAHFTLVRSADLTARVVSGEQLDVAAEIATLCAQYGFRLTLLKGISLCEERYPEPHLREMSDVDVLLDGHAVGKVQALLLDLGYRPPPIGRPDFYASHHHLSPLMEARRQVWVELHRGLFPSSTPISADAVFSRGNVESELRPSHFRGLTVYRLSDDLQLVYLASHWAFGLRRGRGLIGMLDVIRLLAAGTVRWDRILAWLEGSVAATYVYLLLTYLSGRRLADVDPVVLEAIGRQQRSLNRLNVRALHALIDHYVIGCRPYGRLVSQRTFAIAWQTLLAPAAPSRNALDLGRNLLPSWGWFVRVLTNRG
jgi:hypothetical protein